MTIKQIFNSVFVTMLVLILSIPAMAQTEQVVIPESEAGVLPSSRFMWALDRAFDAIQHRNNKEAIAAERLAEVKAEIRQGRAEAADRARAKFEERVMTLTQQQRNRYKMELDTAEKEYNEKFNFDLIDITNRVNKYLVDNNLVLDQNVKVNIIGNKPQSVEVVVSDGVVKEIKKLDVEKSMDATVTLSHGNIWAALQNDDSFKSMARKVVAQVGTQRGKAYIRTYVPQGVQDKTEVIRQRAVGRVA